MASPQNVPENIQRTAENAEETTKLLEKLVELLEKKQSSPGSTQYDQPISSIFDKISEAMGLKKSGGFWSKITEKFDQFDQWLGRKLISSKKWLFGDKAGSAAATESGTVSPSGASGASEAAKASSAFRPLQSIGGAIRGAGKALGLTVGVTAMLKSIADKISDQTAEVQQSNKHLAQMSGAMAAITSVREVQENLRNMQLGNDLAKSVEQLTILEQRRKDAQMDWTRAMNKLENSLLMIGETFGRRVYHILEPIAENIEKIAETIERWFGSTQKSDLAEWALPNALSRENEFLMKNNIDITKNNAAADLFRRM